MLKKDYNYTLEMVRDIFDKPYTHNTKPVTPVAPVAPVEPVARTQALSNVHTKTLLINLKDKYNCRTENTVTIYTLQGSTDYVKRAKNVIIDTNSITKKLQNYILAYSLQCIEEIVLIHGERTFVGYDSIENYISYILTNRAIEYQSTRERKQVYDIIKTYKIPMEVVANIDDYLNTELLQAYDITLGQTTLLCEQRDTYKPTDLQRKEWQINDKDFAFSSNKAKAKYKDFTTLKDKLVAYITLDYYISNGLTSTDYNESTTGNITRKHLNYCADVCGHAHPYQDNDTVKNFIDHERFYHLAY